MNEDNVRYTRTDKEKENKEIRQKYKDMFDKAAENTNYKSIKINSIITSDQIIKNPYIYDNHNKYSGKVYWI